jgi:hypothetical protein
MLGTFEQWPKIGTVEHHVRFDRSVAHDGRGHGDADAKLARRRQHVRGLMAAIKARKRADVVRRHRDPGQVLEVDIAAEDINNPPSAPPRRRAVSSSQPLTEIV